MNREALQKGLSKVAWAYIFLLLDIDFSIGRCTLDFLPNWAGYLILLSSIPLLELKLRDLPLLRPFCRVLAVAEGIEWTAALLTGQSFLRQFLPVSAVWACLAMYVTFQLLTDLACLSEREGIPAQGLLICRNLDVILEAVMFFPFPWEDWIAAAVVLAITGTIVCLIITVRLFTLRRRLGERSAQAEHP